MADWDAILQSQGIDPMATPVPPEPAPPALMGLPAQSAPMGEPINPPGRDNMSPVGITPPDPTQQQLDQALRDIEDTSILTDREYAANYLEDVVNSPLFRDSMEFLNQGANVMTFGMNMLAEAALTGSDIADIVEREETQAASSPVTSTIAQLAGALGGGYGMYKGANAGIAAVGRTGTGARLGIPVTTRAVQEGVERSFAGRVAMASMLSGADASLNRFARGERDVGELAQSFTSGATLAGLLQAGFEGAGARLGRMGLRTPNGQAKRVADVIHNYLRAKQIVDVNGQPITPEIIQRRMLTLPTVRPDGQVKQLTLLDVVPELTPLAEKLRLNTSNPEDVIAFSKFLEDRAARAAASVNGAMNVAQVRLGRTPWNLERAVELQDGLRKNMQPMYDRMFSKADEIGLSVDQADLMEVMGETVAKTRMPADAREALFEHMYSGVVPRTKKDRWLQGVFKDAMKDYDPAVVTKLMENSPNIDMRTLYSMRGRIDDVIEAARSGRKVAGLQVSDDALPSLYEFRKQLNFLNHETQRQFGFNGLAMMDSKFEGVTHLKEVYEAGREIAQMGQITGPKYTEMLELMAPLPAGSTMQEFFQQGIKSALAEQLGTAATPQAALNYFANQQPQLDFLSEVMTPDAVNSLVENLAAATLFNRTIGLMDPSKRLLSLPNENTTLLPMARSTLEQLSRQMGFNKNNLPTGAQSSALQEILLGNPTGQVGNQLDAFAVINNLRGANTARSPMTQVLLSSQLGSAGAVGLDEAREPRSAQDWTDLLSGSNTPADRPASAR